ncbi:EAL and HDOD domain-containing protein [Marinomonas sp. 2405UD68-3]|uniref:EAL and HDOD domain-containing protein n=1 Tax=Marinomonas sp. 2405UD68-3 TaxID=3391835 RepID=UPI0039C93933
MKQATVLFARKAILDSQYKIYAYQLLLAPNTMSPNDGISDILSSLFLDLPIENVVDDKPIFIDMDINNIHSLPALPFNKIVIFLKASKKEILQYRPYLESLTADGYHFGLINPNLEELTQNELQYFIYSKLSVVFYGITNLVEYANSEKLFNKKIIMMDITIKQQLDEITELTSISLFSEDLLNIREYVKENKVPTYKSLISKVLTLINSPLVNLGDISAAIEIDSTLSYKIIKLTKSAMYYQNFNISNVQRALEVIGLRDLSKWFGIALLTSIEGKPDCLYRMAISRAYFVQSLAEVLYPKLEGAFITGLFSYLPVFFDEEMQVLLKDLPLDSKINTALIHHDGKLGTALKVVCLYESGQWRKIPFSSFGHLGLGKEQLKEMYINSLKKTQELEF